MIGQKLPQANTAHDAVIVIVEGGETDPMYVRSLISNEAFSDALIDSLRKTGLFRSVGTSGNAAFRLETTLEDLVQPAEGFVLTVELLVDWRLIRISDKRVIWHEKIHSSYTTAPGVYGPHLRLATEGAARQNIEQGLTKLASVSF
jgi:hypothetical protein